MAKATTLQVQVHFGDCDPAGIVFFPNYLRWMDAASLHYFAACGVPSWRELSVSHGIVGTPLLEIHTRFLNSASYGDTLTIHTHVEQWNGKTFVQKHVVSRGAQLLCEGRETRAFCVRLADAQAGPGAVPAGAGRLKAIAVPPDIRALCEAG